MRPDQAVFGSDLAHIAGQLALQESLSIRSLRRNQTEMRQIATNIAVERSVQFSFSLAETQDLMTIPMGASLFKKITPFYVHERKCLYL